MTWAALLLGYLLGAIPFGYLIYRGKTGRDIRTEGSGNIGATNVARMAGKAAGIVTLLLDVAKGYVSVMLAAWASGGSRGWMSAGAVAVLLGHMFPVFLRFRGGKGVAAAVGAFSALAPLAVLAMLAVFVILVAVWRYISLGSIVAALLFPFATWMVYHPPATETAGAALGAALIVYKHSANIQRLRAGKEPRFSL